MPSFVLDVSLWHVFGPAAVVGRDGDGYLLIAVLRCSSPTHDGTRTK
jgi:hypothetical protein